MASSLAAPAPADPAVPGLRANKGGLPFSVVGIAFFVLLALGLGLGFVIHGKYVGFERVAARHVPPDAALVLRWDVEKVTLFEPTRRFLLPLFDAKSSTNAPAQASGESRRKSLSRAAGLELGRDLREAMLVLGPAESDWALVLAGSFPEGDVLTPSLPVLAADGFRSLGDGRIAAASGEAVARAADGAFVLASSTARLDALLPRRELAPDIERTGAGSFVLRPEQKGLPANVRTVLAPLGAVEVIRGRAEWGKPLKVELTVTFHGSAPADAAIRVRRSLELLFDEELARLERRFGRIVIQPEGNRALRLRLSFDDIALGHAADRASRAVQSALALRPVLE